VAFAAQPRRTRARRTVGGLLAAATLIGTAACASPAADPAPSASAVPHGYVAGAA